MKILCIGDIVGKPGRAALKAHLSKIKEQHGVDYVIANAENSAGGAGLTSPIAKQLFDIGCNVLTLGDHVWDQRELESYLDETEQVIRPANFPEGTPGLGWCIQTADSGQKIGVINLIGRVFMRFHVDCPFRKLTSIVEKIKKHTPIIVVDMHAETTSEKITMGHYSNGQVSAVVGTHTHIQTADEKILSEGTAYITDLGMTGPYDSVIGQNKENIIERFLSSRPVKFHVAKNDIKIHGAVIDIDDKTGKAKSIIRIQEAYVPKSVDELL